MITTEDDSLQYSDLSAQYTGIIATGVYTVLFGIS